MVHFLQALLARWPSTISSREKLLSALVACVAMFVVAHLGHYLMPTGQSLVLVASMGASAMLLFVIPNSPLAQPYPFVMGHVVPAAIGVACALSVDDFHLAAALTVGLSLAVMFLLNCLHPPGGAAALVPILTHDPQALGFSYVLFPVLTNVLCMLALALIAHRWILHKEYPVRALPKRDERHHHSDPSPLSRLGISHADMTSALKDFDAYLNISENDLLRLYSLAQHNAYVRKFGEIRCQDIMSKDVITVEYGTDLEEAWALLRLHKIKVLPVVDKAHRVIGVISLVDILKRADLKTYRGFEEKLIAFIRKSARLHSEKPESVGQVMASPAFTVDEHAYIAALVPMLSDKGLHHVPVINAERRLVGMVSQSDLIAALYQGAVELEHPPE